MQMKPISEANHDGRDVAVCYQMDGKWIVHSAFYLGQDDAEVITGLPDEPEGWWSYMTGPASLRRLDGNREPTHFLCDVTPPETSIN